MCPVCADFIFRLKINKYTECNCGKYQVLFANDLQVKSEFIEVQYAQVIDNAKNQYERIKYVAYHIKRYYVDDFKNVEMYCKTFVQDNVNLTWHEQTCDYAIDYFDELHKIFNVPKNEPAAYQYIKNFFENFTKYNSTYSTEICRVKYKGII